METNYLNPTNNGFTNLGFYEPICLEWGWTITPLTPPHVTQLKNRRYTQMKYEDIFGRQHIGLENFTCCHI